MTTFNTVDERLHTALQAIIQRGHNVVISGQVGAGKTTLKDMMKGFVPSDRSVLDIDASNGDVDRGNIETHDVIIMDELRGAEVNELLHAADIGKQIVGVVHAASSSDNIISSRLANMSVIDESETSEKTIRTKHYLFSNAIDYVVHVDQTNARDYSMRYIQSITRKGEPIYTRTISNNSESIVMERVFLDLSNSI